MPGAASCAPIEVLGKHARKCGGLRYEFLWLPRYSPELQPMERVWAMLKHYCAVWCQHNLKSLMDEGGIIDEGVARIRTVHIRGFIGLAMRWAEHYRDGIASTPPAKIRQFSLQKVVQMGLLSVEDARRQHNEDRVSLDATPQWVQRNTGAKKRRGRMSPAEKFERDKRIAASLHAKLSKANALAQVSDQQYNANKVKKKSNTALVSRSSSRRGKKKNATEQMSAPQKHVSIVADTQILGEPLRRSGRDKKRKFIDGGEWA